MFKESTSTGKNCHVTDKNLEKEMIWLYMYISYLLIHLFQVDLAWKSIFYEILLMQEMRHDILLWKTRQQPMRMQQWLLPQFRPLTPPSMDTHLWVGIMHNFVVFSFWGQKLNFYLSWNRKIMFSWITVYTVIFQQQDDLWINKSYLIHEIWYLKSLSLKTHNM